MKQNVFSNLKGDVFGGITAGIVALPLALAFGIQAFGGIDDPSASSMGALAGLIGATILGFFASVFGGTHSQISGPTGPMTVITAGLISASWTASNGNLSSVIIAMSLAGMFCGIFQILFGCLKIGKYIRYIPYPVLSGFMSGIGVIIILQQIYPLFGCKSPVLVVDMLTQMPSIIAGGISLKALALGLATIAIIIVLPRISQKVPATLVALIVVTIVSLFMDLDDKLTIGSIPAGFPLPFFAKEGLDLASVNWPQVLRASVIPGLTLAGLGSIDTLLTSVVADNITHTHHNSNKELIGQGVGNALAGLFCGIAGAGATMRTVVNVKSGGRTQLSGVIHSLLLLSILLGLGSLVKYVPLAVLAGILITVGYGIIDFKGFRDLNKVPRSDAFVLITVFVVTVFVDLLTAVGIGVVMACVFFMKQAGDMLEQSYSTINLNDYDKEIPWGDEEGMPKELQGKVYMQRLNGPVFFGSVAQFQKVMHDVPANAKIVILRMKHVTYLDQSGVYAFESAINDLQNAGVTVLMTIVQPQAMSMLTTLGVIPNLVSEDHIFPNFSACIEWLRNNTPAET